MEKRAIRPVQESRFPEIASVDMLDTGIDVREIVNLVFAELGHG